MILTGCTCKNTFTIPFSEDDIEAMVITYCQDKVPIVEKLLCDCSFEDGYACVDLSQEDTLKFKDNALVKIQIKIKLNDGSVTKSKSIEVRADEVLNREVL